MRDETVQNSKHQSHHVQIVDGRSLEDPTYFAADYASRAVGIPTPFVLINEDKLKQNVVNFNSSLPEVNLHYAVKANPNYELLKVLKTFSGYFDAASAGEIKILKDLGVQGENIILSHPVKDKQTVKAMINHEIGTAAVDSHEEVKKLAAAFAGKEKKLSLSIRFKTESSGVQVDLNQKFGCRLADVCSIATYAKDHGFEVDSLSFHVGTQSLSAHNYDTGLEHCLFLSQQLKLQSNCCVTTFNIGGGFCDEEYAKLHGKDDQAILREIGYYVAEAQHQGFKVIAEPGRGLLAGTGTLVCEIQGINRRGELPILHINDGIYSTLSPQTYEQRSYGAKILQRPQSSRELLLSSAHLDCSIAGRTCDSLDMLAGRYFFPSNIAVDDILLFPNVSAYGTSVSSRFNGFEPPTTVVFSYSCDRLKLAWDGREVTEHFKIAA